MTAPSIVLMNHTDMQGHHFGCARVMRCIEDELTARGCKITARLDGKQDWRTAPDALAALAACDGIVVNGEGTLHHGRKKAGWLMEVAAHPLTRDKELSLINTIYQDNPDSWAPLLARFQHLHARDSRSAAAMTAQAERPVDWFGDLSTASGPLTPAATGTGIIFSDSVDAGISRALADLAHNPAITEPVRLIPLVVSLREDNPYRPWPIRAFRRRTVAWRQRLQERRYPRLEYLADEASFTNAVSGARLCVTGRFHGVCINLVTGTPFVCLASNSWKIEALFDDLGLDRRRIVTPDRLSPALLDMDWGFSEEESEKIARYLDRAQSGAKAMFDAIAGI